MLNKAERQVIKLQLKKEQKTLDELERQYKKAWKDIGERIRLLQADELTQSKIYQIQYQKALRHQIEGILDKLQGDEYSTIQQYLHDSYQDSFIGTMYSVHNQGIPLVVPVDRQTAVNAILTDTQLSEGLYDELGVNIKQLKKAVRQEITRGIATNMSYADIARNIMSRSKAPLARAKTIVRTEGHRIQEAASNDARNAAKDKGCDVVKQWNSTLDGDTRGTHRELDGQIKETDEPFEIRGKKAMYPGAFGKPEEDCNCRCMALTRAKWNLDEDELKTLKERAAFFELDKSKDFEDFEKKYLKASKPLINQGESGIIQDATELSFAKREEDALSRLSDLENEIKQYDNALAENDRLQENSFDLEEWARLSDEADGIITKRNAASRMVDEVKDQIDSIRRDKAWYRYEKPLAKMQSVAEVEQGIVNAGWFDGRVSLRGVQVDTAKSIAASFNRVFDTYPKLRGKVKGLRTETLGVGIWAGFDPTTKEIIIGLGKYSSDVKTIAKMYSELVAKGYFPKGTDYRSIFVHEMGHAIDFYVGEYKGVERISYGMQSGYLCDVVGFKSAYGNKAYEYIEKQVSKYARSNQKELFAECFSEYMTSPHPRDMAKWYGEQTELALKEWLK